MMMLIPLAIEISGKGGGNRRSVNHQEQEPDRTRDQQQTSRNSQQYQSHRESFQEEVKKSSLIVRHPALFGRAAGQHDRP